MKESPITLCPLPGYFHNVFNRFQCKNSIGLSDEDVMRGGGRYSVLPNGELLIRNAMISDGFKSYRCLTKHILSGDIQLSSTSGRLIITGEF
ncbi:hypothetical protein CEXT_645181 [Caerostris extrusa]|uniref:Uncharacterized protein n=1 Tax=Caerostris extrusa TaxID=172846 RepID=A0AAV4WQ52_CAEEX|nr:hypothetical protein CEXT_645181 [Caerostris extrusa]